jgi:hypothetical protein
LSAASYRSWSNAVSFNEKIAEFVARVADEFRAHKVMLTGSPDGVTTDLATVSKNIVGSINELKAAVDAAGSSGGSSGAAIDDVTASVSTVYSSAKTDQLLGSKANSAAVYTKTQTDALVNGNTLVNVFSAAMATSIQ